MRRFAVLLAVLCLPAALAAGSADAAGCPNEALRAGPSASLPACRAYEMVSPVEKHGGNISPVLGVHVAPGGGAVSFTSSTPFAGASGSPTMNTYIARRGANWVTEAVDPPQFNHGTLVIGASATGSLDLGRTLSASTVALTPGAIEGGSNIYLRDNATGERTLVTATPGGNLFMAFTGIAGGAFLDATPSLSHILLRSSEALPVTEGPEPSSEPNLYEYEEGRMRVVNVLPGGTVSPVGAHIGEQSTPYQHLISTDGSRIFFQTSTFGEGPLYVREDGTTTVPISASRRAADGGEVEPAEFGVASADGSIVYFTSHSPLLEGAGAATGTSHRKLYRYDANTGSLEEVVPRGPEGVEVDHVLGASEDGTYVYFSSPEALAGNAEEIPGTGNFYVAHEGTIKWIGQTSAEETFESSFPSEWSISPDGRHFALAGYSPMNEEDVPSPSACPLTATSGNRAAGDCKDVYVFDYASGRLTCLSCDGPGAGDSDLGGQAFHETGYGDWFPHSVLDDGTVYFDTPNQLSPRDGNGVDDVYAWREGVDQLVSTGTGEQPSTFGNATLDGSDVYFLTSQPLVKQDTDQIIDVYDDREGGGLADQWPPGSPGACEEQGCRGAAPSPPAGLPDGSSVVVPAAASCAPLRAAVGAARKKAIRLGRRARDAARGHGRAAKARSRRLHRRAGVARKQVKRLQKEAAKCGRGSR